MKLKVTMIAFVFGLLVTLFTTGVGAEVGDAQGSIKMQEDSVSIRAIAQRYREDADLRAIAHYLSAEYHRSRYMIIGFVAVIVTGLVTLATAVSKALQNQSGGSAFLNVLGWVLPFLAFCAAVLTGWQTLWNDAEEAAKHKASVVGYEHVKGRIDFFLVNLDLAAVKAEEASKQLNDLMDQYYAVSQNSLVLTERAYADARRQKEATSSH